MKSPLNIFQKIYDNIAAEGLIKNEKEMVSPQGAEIKTADGRTLINMCSNNYLGLSNNPAIINAAIRGLRQYGYGLSSVRFICGTQNIHKRLEAVVSKFLGTEDTILYSSCFDANGGLFETLLSEGDAVISDELNHASIIDGIRLCKAKRLRYKNNDMESLQEQLESAEGSSIKLIVTDGVFSMDGIVANLKGICDLALRYGALVMVDDSHATGFMGEKGRGTHEHCGVMGKVDILTGTFGKALGGASGGYTSGRKEIIQLLRQRSRPYLFSNTLPPPIVCGALKAFEMLESDKSLRAKLFYNTRYFSNAIKKTGFEIIEGESPIIPVMLYDERKANKMAQMLFENGIYAVAFSYPVVPKGKARIRIQVSAALSTNELDYVIEKLREIKGELN